MSTVINGDSNVNLDFSTGGRITGDFSNATIANRALFQTSTANGASGVISIPNGTGVVASWSAQNSSDANNAANIALRASDTDMSVRSGILGTGSYLPMTFYTGGSERMRVDTSGNVLIGTSTTRTNYSGGAFTPAFQIEKAGDIRASITRDSDDTSGPVLYLGKTRGTTVNSNTVVASGDNLGLVSFDGSDGTNMVRGAAITAQVDGTPGSADMPGRLLFSTTADGAATATERMRITSSGQWLFNCTGQTGDAPNTAGGRINETNGNEKVRVAIDSQVAFQFYSPTGGTGGPVGTITVNASSTSYVTSSDYRLKENIAPMTGALAKVAALKPVTYSWKNTGEADEGFIAHELQEVCPNAVVGEKDAVDAEGNPQYQGIDTSFLVATLTAAIQEQQAIITALTARVEALEGTQP